VSTTPRNSSDRSGSRLRSAKAESRIAATADSFVDAEVAIRAATPADVTAIIELLRNAGLAHENVKAHIGRFLVATRAGTMVGAVGAEIVGSDALLRSLVVAANRRGCGLGGRLVDELENVAASWGVQRWWLLTTTAQTFFAARGFHVSSRAAAPAGIQSTEQFSGGCCASAVCMMRERKVGP
jgi:amino-acid N-acetyltransferase